MSNTQTDVTLINKEKETRLLKIYEIALEIMDFDEELSLSVSDYTLDADQFYVERLITKMIKWSEEDYFFEYEWLSREEAKDALSVGPLIYKKATEKLAGAINTALDNWQAKFPECKNFGEVGYATARSGNA